MKDLWTSVFLIVIGLGLMAEADPRRTVGAALFAATCAQAIVSVAENIKKEDEKN